MTPLRRALLVWLIVGAVGFLMVPWYALQDTILGSVLGGGADQWERFVSDPAVGEFLRERLYAPGRRWNWRELVTRATGRPLETRPFVDDLAGRTAPA